MNCAAYSPWLFPRSPHRHSLRPPPAPSAQLNTTAHPLPADYGSCTAHSPRAGRAGDPLERHPFFAHFAAFVAPPHPSQRPTTNRQKKTMKSNLSNCNLPACLPRPWEAWCIACRSSVCSARSAVTLSRWRPRPHHPRRVWAPPDPQARNPRRARPLHPRHRRRQPRPCVLASSSSWAAGPARPRHAP